jgi:hypothetical protein
MATLTTCTGVERNVATQDESDLETFWQDLRGKQQPSLVISGDKPKDYTFALEEAALKAEFDLQAEIAAMGANPVLTSDLLAKLVTKGIKHFIRHWYAAYRNQDVAGLVEFMMDGLNLPTDELKGLMRAMPRSLIDRVVSGVDGTGSGIHALFALEWHFRERNLREDYELYRDDECLKVRVIRDGQAITITLAEKFDLDREHNISYAAPKIRL